MARSLHRQKAWEELAEDPFRGLRAGPVTFSPFLFFPASRNPETASRRWSNPSKNSNLEEARSAMPNEQNSKGKMGVAVNL